VQPIEILQAVRRGYVIAASSIVELARKCPDFDLLQNRWVPRWALVSSNALIDAGLMPDKVQALFARGQAAVQSELNELIRLGTLSHSQAAATRRPYERLSLDAPTEMALTGALQTHRSSCDGCKQSSTPCELGSELADVLQLLFPRDRRQKLRTQPELKAV
jgi:hypothetical protein